MLPAYPSAYFPVPARFASQQIEGMAHNYAGRITDLPTDALPGATRLDGLSPTCIVLSSHDDLRPSGELLERQLAEVKVPVPPTWPTECSTDI